MSEKYSPSFILRGLNVSQILINYEKGEYINLELKKVSAKFQIGEIAIKPHNNAVDAQSDEIFTIKNHGTNIRMLTTNHSEFVNPNIYDANQVYSCRRCSREFKNDPCKIVKAKSIETYLVDDVLVEKITYYGNGEYCTFNCVFEVIKLAQRSFCNTYDTEKAMRYTKEVFFKIYPDEKCIPGSHDPDLLDTNGGPLKRNEFFLTEFKYVKMPNLILHPCKNIFAEYNEVQ
jgi:hypothetical protein